MRGISYVMAIGTLLLNMACSEESATKGPSDDPADYTVDTSLQYDLVVSEPRWIIPSELLPPDVEPMASNNNVDIIYHDDRLFLGWRTAPTHFASDQTQMIVMSSLDEGLSWELEHVFALGSDVREPRFLSFQGQLHFLFFQGGVEPTAFEPQAIWRTSRLAQGEWAELTQVSDGIEVPWDLKVRNGRAYMTSYVGTHYQENPLIDVLFKESTDGLNWNHVDDQASVYTGGVSEAAFEFAADGSLWAVTRNEDGDSTGYGSHVCFAAADALGSWDCGTESDPNRYDSPEMFRHGDDIYLLARRDVGGPFGPEGNLIAYSLRPKRTALYQLDTENRAVVHIMDLPGTGDTAFPSVQRRGPHSFLIANYTSDLAKPDLTWVEGQVADEGTSIYLIQLDFVAQP